MLVMEPPLSRSMDGPSGRLLPTACDTACDESLSEPWSTDLGLSSADVELYIA